MSLNKLLKGLLDSSPDDRVRHTRSMESTTAGRVNVDGRLLVNFASNDYLGLAHAPELAIASAKAAKEYGTGASASRLISGNHPMLDEVESRIASLKGTESALVFGSGYLANQSILDALLSQFVPRLGRGRSQNCTVYTDRLVHASFHAGLKSASIRQTRFRHNDLEHLEQLLVADKNKQHVKFIATESVFSMDGDRLNVPQIRELAKQHNAFLYVDEAHAAGVMGHNGMGLMAREANRAATGPFDRWMDENELVLGTFSKALGSYGAYVACSKVMRQFLVNHCGGLIYTTAVPPSVLGSIVAALELVPAMNKQRNHLNEISTQLRNGIHQLGLDTLQSNSQIIPVIIGDDKTTMNLAGQLEDDGFLVGAIRPPTVPEATARLRISLSAAHQTNDIDRFLKDLSRRLLDVKR